MHERQHIPPAITPDLLEAFIATFFVRQDVYAIQRADGHYTARQGMVTPTLVQNHLQGALTLGTYCLNQEGQAHWMVIDADDNAIWAKLISLMPALSVPIYLEQSRRGGHAWIFFEQSEPGRDVRCFAQGILRQRALDTIEVYPKQDRLNYGPGSLIRLPFGFHRKVKVPGQPGKRFVFQTPEGQPLAPTVREQIAVLTQAKRLPHAVLQAFFDSFPEPPPPESLIPTFRTRPTDVEQPLSERIKASIGVLEFISQYVSLDEHHTGFCPFHEDQHKSFGVNAARNYWSCFAGCGGGSIIDFWMQWRARAGQDGSFTATVTDLACILNL